MSPLEMAAINELLPKIDDCIENVGYFEFNFMVCLLIIFISFLAIPMAGGANLSKSIIALVVLLFIGYTFVLYSVVFPAPPPKCADVSPLADTALLTAKETETAKLVEELEKMKMNEAKKAAQIVVVPSTKADLPPSSGGYRPGLFILGMHRSGTSIVGGLINKMGLKTGGPLIQAAEDNEKGFFERIDVVLQNDELMRRQGVSYSNHMYKYDDLVAIKDIVNSKDDLGSKLFNEGKRGLKFLNDPNNYPWMLKDPRMCVTFRTWFPFLNFIPAVLFTYRHPMDVAQSFFKRYEHLPIGKSLRMWYVYNRRAIMQSHDLCRVTTSHRAVMTQPLIELDRIYDELRRCGVMASHRLTKAEVEDFVDPKLQHGKSALKDTTCGQDLTTLMPPSTWPTRDESHFVLYREVMRVFCALEDGSAFSPTFQWDMSIQD